MLRILFIACAICLLDLGLWAQKDLNKPASTSPATVSASEKTASQTKEKVKKEKGKFKANWALPYPNPYRAAIYTLVLPGAGQIYNKRYWKAPLVWGGFGGLVYAVSYNRDLYNCFNEAYGKELRNLPHKLDDRPYTSDGLKRARDSANKNLQLSYLGFVAMYALSALDAYVDAHLKNFDISDDLSFAFRPITNGIKMKSVNPGIGVIWKL